MIIILCEVKKKSIFSNFWLLLRNTRGQYLSFHWKLEKYVGNPNSNISHINVLYKYSDVVLFFINMCPSLTSPEPELFLWCLTYQTPSCWSFHQSSLPTSKNPWLGVEFKKLIFCPQIPLILFLSAARGNVFSLLYVVGGLLMTVTAGSRCVDVAVSTAQNPANLKRLSNALVRLVGLRFQIHVVRNLQQLN